MKFIILNFVLAIGIFGYFFVLPESTIKDQVIDIKQVRIMRAYFSSIVLKQLAFLVNFLLFRGRI